MTPEIRPETRPDDRLIKGARQETVAKPTIGGTSANIDGKKQSAPPKEERRAAGQRSWKRIKREDIKSEDKLKKTEVDPRLSENETAESQKSQASQGQGRPHRGLVAGIFQKLEKVRPPATDHLDPPAKGEREHACAPQRESSPCRVHHSTIAHVGQAAAAEQPPCVATLSLVRAGSSGQEAHGRQRTWDGCTGRRRTRNARSARAHGLIAVRLRPRPRGSTGRA